KRAEEILDLGMEKMPLDLYGHYSMIEPFVNGYYEVGQVDKAQNLLDRVILKYQDEIDFYKALNIDERRASYSDIIAAVERYRSLVESAIFYEDDKMVQKHKDVFNQYVLEFTQFYSPEETIGGSSREEIPTSELDNIFQEATDNTVTEDIIETNPQDTP
ncbi:MAG: hypothetical protein ABJC32_11450, partial [Nonlabens ulvanivorans]